MNDDELTTAVRESVAGIHTATSVEQIVSRGRARRTRRWMPSLAGALAIAAAVAAAVLVPSGHPVGHPSAARLAAWTVAKKADGTITVIIREFRDPAGLQRKLRADGLPASVIFYPSRLTHHMPFRKLFHVRNNPCQEYRDQSQLLKVVPPQRPAPPLAGHTAIVIRPPALPNGAGVQFIATSNIGHPQTYGTTMLGVWLVQATQQCTGS
jgi:hypothetical protein